MTPTNRKVLDFVLASPVGKAMSDADRESLRLTLENTDARDLQGWLGEQVRKAARAAFQKGDYDGHPFRGNQWTDASGAGRGGAGGPPKGRSTSLGAGKKIDVATAKRMMGDYDKMEAKARKENLGDPQDYAQARFREKYGLKAMDVEDVALGLRPPNTLTIPEKAGDTAKPSTPPSANPKSMSTAELKLAADELAASVEEKLGMAEVERDLGRTAAAKVTLQEAKSAQAELKQIRQELDSRAKAVPKPSKGESRKIQITPDNLDDELKGSERKGFVADHKAAAKAAKDFREFVGEVADRARAAGVRGASALLKEALDETRRFEQQLKESSSPTIRNSMLNFSMLNNYGENAKGAIREVLDLIDKADAKRQGPFGTRTTARQARGAAGAKQEARDTDRSAALQSASDKDFGLSSDKYNMLDAWDVLENN